MPAHRGKWLVVESLRKVFGLNLKGEFLVSRQGLWWTLDPGDPVHSQLFWFGAYDNWELFHILRLLNEGSVIFDVGANLGQYAVTLGARRRDARIYAFEPNPPAFERLVKHINLNGLRNVTAHSVGISDKAGASALIESVGNSGRARLIEGDGVRVTTLDHFCEAHCLQRLDFMKVDVEGFEEKVLRGGARVLEQFRPIIMIELAPALLAQNNTTVGRVVDILGQFGYVLFEVKRKQLVRLRNLPEEYFINCFCLHRGKLSDRL